MFHTKFQRKPWVMCLRTVPGRKHNFRLPLPPQIKKFILLPPLLCCSFLFSMFDFTSILAAILIPVLPFESEYCIELKQHRNWLKLLGYRKHHFRTVIIVKNEKNYIAKTIFKFLKKLTYIRQKKFIQKFLIITP